MEQVTIKIDGKVMTAAEWVQDRVVPCIVGMGVDPEAMPMGWMPPEVP